MTALAERTPGTSSAQGRCPRLENDEPLPEELTRPLEEDPPKSPGEPLVHSNIPPGRDAVMAGFGKVAQDTLEVECEDHDTPVSGEMLTKFIRARDECPAGIDPGCPTENPLSR